MLVAENTTSDYSQIEEAFRSELKALSGTPEDPLIQITKTYHVPGDYMVRDIDILEHIVSDSHDKTRSKAVDLFCLAFDVLLPIVDASLTPNVTLSRGESTQATHMSASVCVSVTRCLASVFCSPSFFGGPQRATRVDWMSMGMRVTCTRPSLSSSFRSLTHSHSLSLSHS